MGNHNGRLARLEMALKPPAEPLLHQRHAYTVWCATLAPMAMIPFGDFQPAWYAASRIHLELQQGYPSDVLLHCCTRECPPLLPALTAYLAGGVERFTDPYWFLLHDTLPYRASQRIYPYFLATLSRAVQDSWSLVKQRWDGLSEDAQHELVAHWLRLHDVEAWLPLCDAYDAGADLELCKTQFITLFDAFEQRILRNRPGWSPDDRWYQWNGRPYGLQPVGKGIEYGEEDSKAAWQRHAMALLAQEWVAACPDEVRDIDQAGLLEQLDASAQEEDA